MGLGGLGAGGGAENGRLQVVARDRAFGCFLNGSADVGRSAPLFPVVDVLGKDTQAAGHFTDAAHAINRADDGHDLRFCVRSFGSHALLEHGVYAVVNSTFHVEQRHASGAQ